MKCIAYVSIVCTCILISCLIVLFSSAPSAAIIITKGICCSGDGMGYIERACLEGIYNTLRGRVDGGVSH